MEDKYERHLRHDHLAVSEERAKLLVSRSRQKTLQLLEQPDENWIGNAMDA